jgi:hypothetical protein
MVVVMSKGNDMNIWVEWIKIGLWYVKTYTIDKIVFSIKWWKGEIPPKGW